MTEIEANMFTSAATYATAHLKGVEDDEIELHHPR